MLYTYDRFFFFRRKFNNFCLITSFGRFAKVNNFFWVIGSFIVFWSLLMLIELISRISQHFWERFRTDLRNFWENNKMWSSRFIVTHEHRVIRLYAGPRCRKVRLRCIWLGLSRHWRCTPAASLMKAQLIFSFEIVTWANTPNAYAWPLATRKKKQQIKKRRSDGHKLNHKS